MDRKEEIIFAALELSAKNGISSVSLSQIADKIGIKKPSLYNHFKSKDDIINSMYIFIREQAQKRYYTSNVDYAKFFEGKKLEDILLMSYQKYSSFISDTNMLKLFKVIYSERTSSPAAAQIMVEETERMISSIKELFYALVVHGIMQNKDTDTAALSYAMTIHSLIDHQLDMLSAGIPKEQCDTLIENNIRSYIKWFCDQMEVK